MMQRHNKGVMISSLASSTMHGGAGYLVSGQISNGILLEELCVISPSHADLPAVSDVIIFSAHESAKSTVHQLNAEAAVLKESNRMAET